MNGPELREALTEARELHHAGRLDEARAAYRALRRQVPDDAEVPGLLGVLALQQGQLDEAGALLRAALAAGGEARIRLRNINNLLALLQRTGDADAARALVEAGLPDWPAGVTPRPAERTTVLSLCSALLLLDQAAAARRLLERAIPEPGGDREALALMGRILALLDAFEPAAECLRGAADGDDVAPETLTALAFAEQALGRPDAARATMRRIWRLWPVWDPRPEPRRRPAVLLLNQAPTGLGAPGAGLRQLHFSANFAAQLANEMQDEFRFISTFADLPDATLPAPLPERGVILNNCVNAEMMNAEGQLERILSVVKRAGMPVINHPRAIFDTTRQKTAALLAGIPGLKVPRIERYRTDLRPVEEIAADIEGRFDYPVILRKCQAHNSSRLQHSATARVSARIDDAEQLRDCLTTFGWREIYAIEYVPLRKRSGHFRKIRAVLAEDDVIVAIPGFAGEWMVAGGRGRGNAINYYRAHPETTEESRRIVRDPEGSLGADCLRVLAAVRDRLPLDICGIDFDVDDRGEVVFFEANAAMNLLRRRNEPADVALPDAPFDRIRAAFRRAVDRRLAGTG